MNIEEFLKKAVMNDSEPTCAARSVWPEENHEKTIHASENAIIRIHSDYISKIFINEEKRIIVVKFVNGEIEKIVCNEEDHFDPTVGVALAICRHLFGHTTFYKHIVKKKAVVVGKKEKPVKEEVPVYEKYLEWCEKYHKRKPSAETFKKYKKKYLANMAR